MPSTAPVVLLVYNRPDHTRKTLVALSKNILADKTSLFIYADGPKLNSSEEQQAKMDEVRTLIREQKWCHEVFIIERQVNLGIGESTISAVTEIINRFGKVIVLEDDIETSIGFLKFMNEGLEFYAPETRVMHISGYMHPVKKPLPDTFFYNATSCWGWGTWKRAWDQLKTDSESLLNEITTTGRLTEFTLDHTNRYDYLLAENGKVEKNTNRKPGYRNDFSWNWDVCWSASVFVKRGFCLHPGVSLVRNIGHDASGIHCKGGWWSDLYLNQERTNSVLIRPIELIENKRARVLVKKLNQYIANPPLWIRMKEKALILTNKAKNK